MLDLPLNGPLMNAAGTLGFAPNPRLPHASFLDAFVTNPISLRPRTPANGPRMLAHSGGILVHTGHPNPGFSKVLKQYAAKWRRSSLPVFVHLLAETADDLYRMVRRLEETEGVSGVEFGLPPSAGPDQVHAAVQAAIGELPVIVKLGLDQVQDLAGEAKSAGTSAISFGPPRGSLPGADGALTGGRLFGRSLYPQALQALRSMPDNLDVIFAGGIRNLQEAKAALALGAAAVQLGIVLWKTKPEADFSAPSGSS